MQTITPFTRPLAIAAAAAALLLAGCGGGGSQDSAATAGPTGVGTGTGTGAGTGTGGTTGGASALGPTVDLSLLAQLCPTYDATSKTYSHCKASSNATVNGVLIDIDAWLAAHSPTQKVASSLAPDASYAVAAGDACGFSLEPGLGIWMMTLKGAAGPSIAWTGSAIDTVQVDANGVIVYMSASTDGTGAGFTNASGQMEINFPGATGGTISEVVYGHDSKFVDCTLAG